MHFPSFDYLRDVADKYGRFYAVKEFESFVDSVTDEQIRELSAAYHLINFRGDAPAISRWIDHCFEFRNNVPKLEFDFSSKVGQLLLLFQYLGDRGIQPFASRAVQYVEQTKAPDWSNLPGDLHYLIELAEEYGVYSNEEDVITFLNRAHPNDLEKLAIAAERMRLNGHIELVNQWLKRFPLDKHPEAWLIHCLLTVMDHAGFKFDESL